MHTSKKATIIGYAITACIFTALAIGGRFGSITGNEIGYSLLSFYLIMPLTIMYKEIQTKKE